MFKKFFTLYILLFISLLPLQAQWQRGVRSLKQLPHYASKTRPRFSTLANKRAERTIANQLKNITQQRASTLKKAVFPIILPEDDFEGWDNPHATAFVLEENYKGKKTWWGVSVSHYHFLKPQWENPYTHRRYPLTFTAQGSFGFNDVTLFPLPPKLHNQVRALSLATEPVQVGDALYSAGYFDEDFQLEENRTVTEVSNHRIVTSLQVPDKLAREGACGGPVLNAKGKLVGIHAGSSQRRQVGFVIPAQHIQELLTAYHHNGQLTHTLRFNGKKLGQININEHIQLIETWKDTHLLNSFYTYRDHSLVDYEHLEKMIDTTGADRVVFVIETDPFSMLEGDQSTRFQTIIYHLDNQQITIKAGGN